LSRKQQLLKRHRRNKRVALLIGVLLLMTVGVLVAWWLPLLLALLGWMAHEAWFADHLFYSPKDDYLYNFAKDAEVSGVSLAGDSLRVDAPLVLAGDETLILAITLSSTWLGRFLDPAVELTGAEVADCQAFERGVDGVRYLNLSGLGASLADGSLRLSGRFCRQGFAASLGFSPA
jgi:hypothetical protein